MPSSSFTEKPDEVWFVRVNGNDDSFRNRMFSKLGPARGYRTQLRNRARRWNDSIKVELLRGTVTWEEVEL